MSKLSDNDNIRNDIYENLPCQAMYNDSVRKMQQQQKQQQQQQQKATDGGGVDGFNGGSNTNTNASTNLLSQQMLLNNMSNQNANLILDAGGGNISNTANLNNRNHHNFQQSQQQQQHNQIIPSKPKEMLYATPLRKSDRYKSGERSRFVAGGQRDLLAPAETAKHHQAAGALDYGSKYYNHSRDSSHRHAMLLPINRNGNAVPVTDLDDDTTVDVYPAQLQPTAATGLTYTNRTRSPSAASVAAAATAAANHQMEERRILNFLKDTTQLQKKMEIAGRNGGPSSVGGFSNLAREEHFANLVQQNFADVTDSHGNTFGKGPENELNASGAGTFAFSANLKEETADNLEAMMQKKLSPDKEFNGIVTGEDESTSAAAGHCIVNSVHIQREWVLKKIALCLEQRTASRKGIVGMMTDGMGLACGGGGVGSPGAGIGYISARAAKSSTAAAASGSYNGCLILGSNGSGKTSICEAIMAGNTGTRGILNRKLLACYLVESQNPECHSLSLFMRKLVLQILSFSSLIDKDNSQRIIDEGFSFLQDEVQEQESKLDEVMSNITLNDNAEEILIEELKRGASECDTKELENFGQVTAAPGNRIKTSLSRQRSEPAPPQLNGAAVDVVDKAIFGTHPPKRGTQRDSEDDKDNTTEKELKNAKDGGHADSLPQSAKSSPGKRSKIPVKRGRAGLLPSQSWNSNHVLASHANSANNSQETVQEDGGEAIADKLELEGSGDMKDDDAAEQPSESKTEIEAALEDEAIVGADKKPTQLIDCAEVAVRVNQQPKTLLVTPAASRERSPLDTSTLPPPLPKTKNCRTVIADGYYEMIISNAEILECLNVDNIEKNPDECFKKALLFPLLELTPPKTALLLLIDSIDENYINEGCLITTLKGVGRASAGGVTTNNPHKSRNVAELLSNHVHLFPKWLFLVCTTKKQTKQITKMFTGFKKITLDDLRKAHVVKDVQEYIISRLNTDFKNSIMLTKEIIESLHQLYIKSNGCILYLEKVLNGIKENFFSFREIKLIPCTLNGLYLYICQKSFNKKQYMKIRPVLNVLLASTGYVDKLFLFNCLRTHNYAIDYAEFEKRLQLMKNILTYDSSSAESHCLKIFHNSFADWLVDVKFATKKFICDVNEGHVMISMYYLLVADTLCANSVRKFAYHLLKSGEYLTNRDAEFDVILMLLESRLNIGDSFYTNALNCCAKCEQQFKRDPSFLPKTRNMLEKFLANDLADELAQFLCDFFKPNLPTDAKVLKLLIETGINNAETQNSCDSSLMSPQTSEVSQNIDLELAELLLATEKSCIRDIQRGISPTEKSEPPLDGQDEKPGGTLHKLSESNYFELHRGQALIHILAYDGNHELLERALNACNGTADVEIEDYLGQTALNVAARQGHLEVAKLLLSYAQPANDGTGRMKRIDVNHANHDGWTPLRSASWGGHTEVVKLLLAHPACKIDYRDIEGRTALRAAAWGGHEDILKILIDAGADVNSVDKQGRTCLIAASYMGHYDILDILLENGADVNHLDMDGRSALCVAALCCRTGFSQVMSTLLEHGANSDQLDNDGMSPLLVSSFEGNAEVCELLLENGADPDLADFMGRTPLWAACTAGHANVVKLLLFWGCGIDCMDSEGRTVLSIAAAQGNVETVRQLLDRGLDETHRDNAGWTPLHYAAFEGFHEVCVQLLESGAKIDECDNEGKTALHLAAQEGRLRCVQALLDIHASFVDQKAHDGKTAFRLACLEGHLETLAYLLKFSCDVNSKDADSRTTLYILALENKLEVVKYLLETTNVDVDIPDGEGRTALHVAAWQGHAEMVKLLITMGHADVNSMDLEARTPLHSCAWQGNHDVMNILLYFGAIPDHACKQGASALGISAQEGHDKCVIALLRFGANPYKSDHCGRTPIKLAAKSNRTNILKIFENYTKNEASNPIEQRYHHSNMLLRSPEQQAPPALPIHQSLGGGQGPPAFPPPHASANSVCSAATTATVSNNSLMPSNAMLNASSSTHSSNQNFYQNTLQSDASSLHKRKSVISSQSTGSSNEKAPLSFAQQLQRQSKLSSRNNPFLQNAPVISGGRQAGSSSSHKPLANIHHMQHHFAPNMISEADLYDVECMSPLYATPPHSPSSELSSPGQHSTLNNLEEVAGASGSSTSKTGKSLKSALPDNHFARDTHMRIILGNLKENQPTSSGKSKRSGITTNPAMRLIRSRFDSAAQLIRRTNNILSSSSNQGSSSIGVKSGTFQWRKESQM